ncbi:glycerate kinase [Sporormia fimetaria CBS 119925]|uniref:Glycerate kinase n=1 Tax=Sporormia fimetaria CBS 119925 TaxID=1340428 RepID=A0A6A6UZE4_9PLEO|nr:glycerate kinase [Sporormia fimetaria CBS 119925]
MSSVASSSSNPVNIASFHCVPLRILVAPSGFKESLGPEQIADAIETGVRQVFDAQQAIVHKLPLHDGGEGFCKALVYAKQGYLLEATVMGPVGNPISSQLGFIDSGRTAVLDMAAAAGLRMVPKNMRDPTITTTYGVGELILHALNAGCRKIIIGCGDSGTSDGGAGMLQALGVRLLDKSGKELPRAGGGKSLVNLHRIWWGGVHPRLREDAGKLRLAAHLRNLLACDRV